MFEHILSCGFFKRFGHFAGVHTARSALLLIAFASLLLAGCSGLRIVDSQVNAFSQLAQAPAAGASWQIERLPSQQSLQDAAAARQDKLEAWVAQELAKVGFAPQPQPQIQPRPQSQPTAAGAPPITAQLAAPPAAQFTVQINARIQRLESGPFDYPEPWGGAGFGGSGWGGVAGRDYVVTGAGRVIYLPVFPRHHAPWYVREVSLILRDAKSKAIVYETQAKHEGRWADDQAVLPAMLAAALQGFPKPPVGKRLVNVEIPR